VLVGNAGANVLSGLAGNDVYVVQAGDTVVEGLNQGTDTVRSDASYVLGANIENLVLTGTGDIDGTGNMLANAITGNSGNNRLDGGAGADILTGSEGDDTYVVDNAADKVIETLTLAQNGGIDTVESSATYAITPLANIDNLTLTGAGNINGTGNALANIITGNSGNNSINGGSGDDTLFGGIGSDTLLGWKGADTFLYTNMNEAGDTITDFTKGVGGDILKLDDLLDGLGYAGSDPFAEGFLSFDQVGANTQVRVDTNGGGDSFQTLVTLTNVALTQADVINYADV
jgi:Ca2+-binding RTX toxin-like protein